MCNCTPETRLIIEEKDKQAAALCLQNKFHNWLAISYSRLSLAVCKIQTGEGVGGGASSDQIYTVDTMEPIKAVLVFFFFKNWLQDSRV